MVNGSNSPIGSNSVAIFFRKLRFVYFMLSSGAFSLNVKTSLSASHHTPSVLADGKCSVSKSTSAFLSRCGISCIILGAFDNYFRACMPAFVNRTGSSLYSDIPCSSFSTESIELSI